MLKQLDILSNLQLEVCLNLKMDLFGLLHKNLTSNSNYIKQNSPPNTPGIAHFGNPPILPDQTNTTLVSLPKTTTLGITTTTSSSLISTLSIGRKIAGTNPGTFGHIVGTGSSVSTI